MNKILTIAGLTWKSAFRYRLFWIMAVLLVGAVVGLPLILEDDGTAKGLTQILLTYTLTAVTTLLGFATLWLSCGTLAKDVEDCQMQVVSVKPIARWQIWLGKWFGILSLNAVLLMISGGAIYGLLQYRANRLPADQQAILHKEVFISRASAKRPPMNLNPQIDKILAQVIAQSAKKNQNLTDYQIGEIRQQIAGRVMSEWTEVAPSYYRTWGVDLHTVGGNIRNEPMQLRIKFHAANPNPDAEYWTEWVIGPTNSSSAVDLRVKLPPDSFQEISVPPNLLDDRGILWVGLYNPQNTALTFPLDDGFELLYPETTFAVNFIRGIAVIFCWLALLASIGLAFASFLSFPVAAFASLAVLLMGFSSGTIGSVVEQGTITGFDSAKSAYGHSPADIVMVPAFRGALKIIKLVQGFSPIDDLSSGRSITWGQLGMAFAQIILLLGGFFCVCGIIFFTRRELATAQGNT